MLVPLLSIFGYLDPLGQNGMYRVMQDLYHQQYDLSESGLLMGCLASTSNVPQK